jgi:hypothetical protein
MENPHSSARTCEIDSGLPLTNMADNILQARNENDSGNAW